MPDPVLLVARDAGIASVTLNRPTAMNALSRELRAALVEAFTGLAADPFVRVVILTGAGRAFCAGLDLKELGESAENLRGVLDDPSGSPFTALATMTKPVIGAINGPCVTGGFEVALACDFLVASERAVFADTHARVGLTPGGGMSVNLPQSIGLRKAKEMSLTGNYIDADEAHRLGLVNHVVAHGELIPRATALATEIAHNDQGAVRNLKQLYDEGERLTVGDAWRLEQERFRSWKVDPAEIERRRAGIVERGRGQTQGPARARGARKS
jgi:enoyl-CoA hydratase